MSDKIREFLESSDGEPDWDALRSTAPELSETIQKLQRIGRIARAFEKHAQGTDEVLFRWGPLDVHEKLGQGTSGEVFRASDARLEREVALKLRHPSVGRSAPADSAQDGTVPYGLDNAEALGEARRLARIRHPNVVLVYGADLHDGRVGIWTELLKGDSLEGVTEKSGPLPAEEVVRMGVDLCSALSAIHGAELIHGDIKPANVIREPTGRVVLVDFGSGQSYRKTTVAGLAATPLTAAPELLLEQKVSPACDLYSLGCVLYRLVSGSYPVTAASLEDLIELQKSRVGPSFQWGPEADAGMPSVLWECLRRVLDPNPENRFRSAAEMGRALQTVLDQGAQTPRHQLPAARNRFFGRGPVVQRLREELEEHRLVMISGLGGCGKTRVATEVAGIYLPSVPDGAWWIDLAQLSSLSAVERSILDVLGVREDSGQSRRDRIRSCLADRTLLLILDNCEHLVDDIAELSRWILSESATVRILATSRVPLGIEAEFVHQLPAMEIPSETDDPETLQRNESVQLFLDRAYRYGRAIELNKETAPGVARICRELEGVPLAIELAAARTLTLDPEAIADRLEDRFRILSTRKQRDVPHHRSLLASMEWSYELLSPDEQRLFERLSAFRGSWSLDSAEAVCSDDALPEEQILDLITLLMEKALIEPIRSGRTQRFRLLETVREFAVSRLSDPARMEERHREHFLAHAEQEAAGIRGRQGSRWVRAFEHDEPNFRSAIQSFLDGGDLDSALRLLTALRGFLGDGGRVRESSAFIEELLSRDTSSVSASTLAWAHTTASRYATRRSHFPSAIAHAEEAVRIFRELGDREGLAEVLTRLAGVRSFTSEFEKAEHHLEEAIGIWEELGNKYGLLDAYGSMGTLRKRQIRPEDGLRAFEKQIALGEEMGELYPVVSGLVGVGACYWDLGENEKACEVFREGLAKNEELGDENHQAWLLANLGTASPLDDERRLGYFDAAIEILRRHGDRRMLAATLLNRSSALPKPTRAEREMKVEFVEIHRDLGTLHHTGIGVISIATLDQEAFPEDSVRLLSAVVHNFEREHVKLVPYHQKYIDTFQKDLRSMMEPDAFDAAWAEGASWDGERMIEEARRVALRDPDVATLSDDEDSP